MSTSSSTLPGLPQFLSHIIPTYSSGSAPPEKPVHPSLLLLPLWFLFLSLVPFQDNSLLGFPTGKSSAEPNDTK